MLQCDEPMRITLSLVHTFCAIDRERSVEQLSDNGTIGQRQALTIPYTKHVYDVYPIRSWTRAKSLD